MNVNIRPATLRDMPGILEIVNYEIVHTTAIYDYNPRNLETQVAWFEDKAAHGFPVIVADDHGYVAGFGAYGTFRVRDAYQYTVEHSVYAAQGYQGKGIGRMLMEELIRLARIQKMHSMIGGIDALNTGSIDFHKKFGFQEAGLIKDAGYKFDRWLDLVFMQLILE